MIAIGSLFWNVMAVKYGKRPVYLITSVGLVVTCFWAAAAKSFGNFVAARIVQGFCMSPMEALIPASIADIWFVHERGYRTAVFNLGVLGGINLATPIAGAILQNSSWRVVMNAMGGAFILQLILTFFFMPESAFKRTGTLNIDTGKHAVEGDKMIDSHHMENEKSASASATAQQPAVSSSPVEPKMSFMQEMKPWSGYVNHISIVSTTVRPFFLLASPAVAWATLLFTTCISWLVGISLTLSQIFSAPPYNFSVRSVGATNLSSFVASVLGTMVAGPLIDGIVKRMSKRNKGIFEPEFRLPVMVTYLLFTATGFFGWGQAAYAQEPWPIAVVLCLGIINFGIQLGTTGVVAYVVDCHREQAGEAFAVMNFIKNMFAFGMTFYINDWIATGIRDCFFTIGGITVFCTLITIPMYIWGKRARSWVARHDIAKRTS